MVSFVFVKVIEGKFSAGRTTTDVVVPPTDIEVTSELTFYGLLGHALADRSQKYLGSSDEQGGGAVVVCTMHSTIEFTAPALPLSGLEKTVCSRCNDSTTGKALGENAKIGAREKASDFADLKRRPSYKSQNRGVFRFWPRSTLCAVVF